MSINCPGFPIEVYSDLVPFLFAGFSSRFPINARIRGSGRLACRVTSDIEIE